MQGNGCGCIRHYIQKMGVCMRQTIQWNHMWAFTKMADAAPTEMPGKWDFVNLPHTWNGLDGQDGGDDYYRGTCWYAKELKKADLPEADRYYLEFEGTNSSAVLYIDGKEIARHDGGYSTWRADITDALGKQPRRGCGRQRAEQDRLSAECGLHLLRRHLSGRLDPRRVEHPL